jgi:hypothetical protein
VDRQGWTDLWASPIGRNPAAASGRHESVIPALEAAIAAIKESA